MAAPAPALPRYVDLIRVSTRGQADRDTPDDQRAALDRLRFSRPGRLVERIELQVSGAAGREERLDLRRLAELAAAQAFDEVRVRHFDRLTRHDDPDEQEAVFSLVRRAGAVIVEADGGVIDPGTLPGRIVSIIKAEGAAEERRKIRDRTMAAKRRLAAEGRLVSSAPPWGRTWSKERGWGLEEAQAAVYRRLFSMVLRGLSLAQIADTLNAEGVTTATGRPWTRQNVGNRIGAAHASGRWRSHGAEARIPPIVDEATQAEAIRRMKANDHASGRHDVKPALLRKLLVCGVCGASMHTDSRTGGGLYYYCGPRAPSCRKLHPVASVDKAVRDRVYEWSRTAGRVAAEHGAPDDRPAAEAAIATARREIKRLDREEENLLRLHRRGLGSQRAHERQLAEVARLRAAAESRIHDAEARIEGAARRAAESAELEQRIARLRSGLDGAGFTEWRELMEILFDRSRGYGVRIWPSGQIQLDGALPLDDVGEAALREAGRDLKPPSRTRCQIPVRLDAWVAGRKRR